jgi:hypothetical protein
MNILLLGFVGSSQKSFFTIAKKKIIGASVFTFYQFLSLSRQGSGKKNHHRPLRRGRASGPDLR